MTVPFIALDFVAGDTVRLTLFVDAVVDGTWQGSCVFDDGVSPADASVSITEAGSVVVELEPEQTAVLGPLGSWNAQLVSPLSDVFTVARGSFKVFADETPGS